MEPNDEPGVDPSDQPGVKPTDEPGVDPNEETHESSDEVPNAWPAELDALPQNAPPELPGGGQTKIPTEARSRAHRLV